MVVYNAKINDLQTRISTRFMLSSLHVLASFQCRIKRPRS